MSISYLFLSTQLPFYNLDYIPHSIRYFSYLLLSICLDLVLLIFDVCNVPVHLGLLS